MSEVTLGSCQKAEPIMAGFPRLTLAARVMLGATAFLMLAASASVYLIVDASRKTYVADRGTASAIRAERNAQQIVQSIDILRRDVLFLSRVPPVQSILQMTLNQGIDPIAGRSLGFWKMHLQEIFSSFAEARPEYYQLHYIGVADNGRELVRVDVEDNYMVVTPPDKLQTNSDRDYFQATLGLKAGEVYLSEINLNQERGEIQVPHVRTLRASTPVFADDGTLFGMVMVSMNVGRLIDSVTTNLPPGIHAYLMNDKGDYLAHPDPGRAFGFDLGQRYAWQRDMPTLQVPAISGGAGHRSPQVVSSPEGLQHLVVERAPFDPHDTGRFLLLAYALPDAFVNAQLKDLRELTITVAFAVTLGLSTVVFLLLRWAFAPLTRLTGLAESISAGRYDVPLPTKGVGELGGFIRAFRSMLDSISTREHEIKQISAKLQTVFENLTEGVVVSDLNGQLLYFNRAAVEIHGFTSTEEYLRRLQEFVDTFELADPDGKIWPVEQWPLARVLRGENLRDLEVCIRRIHTAGWQRTFSYSGAIALDVNGKSQMAVVTMRDITEQKLTNETVRASREQYYTLFNTLIEGFCIIEVLFDADNRPIDYRFLEINAAFEAQTGLRNAQGKRMREIAPDHEDHWFAIYGKVALTGESTRFENEAKALNRWFDVSAYRIGGQDSRKVGILFNDITTIRQAEQKVRTQLQHLQLLDHITRSIGERQDLRSIFQVVVRSLENSLPIDFGCVCLYDPGANAVRVMCVGVKSGPLARELTLDEQAAIDVDNNGLGRCIQGQLVYEPDIGQVAFPFPARLAQGGLRALVMAPLRSESRVFGVLVAARHTAHSFSSGECEFLRQLSEHVALAAHQAQLYGALQQAYDDLRQTQQAAMQQERLRALGQMASGIAHDINNALSPMTLFTESILESEKNLSKRARGHLQIIQRAVEDVTQTVARMREFYRQREPQLSLVPIEMNSIIQQVIDLTHARWSDMPQQNGILIRMQTEFGPNLPMIMGVESELREALINLVFNAVDAMPEGGTLIMRTRFVDIEQKTGRASVVIEVIDEGVGMDEDTRQRSLEPFFTTKGERGTGLGLAMVFGVVQRLSAEIEIESAPGAGTTVRLIFAVPAAVLTETGQHPAMFAVPSQLRLLLIDDDPILLKSLQDVLETDGNFIVSANGGEEGITVFRASLKRGDRFDAVFTDLGMPYVDGRRVAAAVKETAPDTPVILLTGWGQRLIADDDIPLNVDCVLAKPPKLRVVRETLARLCMARQPGPVANTAHLQN